ncbi:Glutathione synthetase [Elsinoe australis]|uniref:nitric oxide dioxygenase n=1 Tax=Elsinoe australis TaxID=40998 RepID=A0A2P8AIT6_9PEZI|nr:Glutathione synthetase [Elsinoe australis]
MPLADDQVSLVQSSIPALEEHGTKITSTFYTTMLSENPSLRNIFNLTNQRTNSQPLALASVLAAYATHITNPSALAAPVEAINHRHVSLGVTAEQYNIVGTYLLRAMSEVLGAALTEELKGAWGAAYMELAGMMIKAEEAMYERSQKERWEQPSKAVNGEGHAGASKETGSAEQHFRQCRVVKKEQEAEDVVSLRFWPKDWEGQELPRYKPGQYVSVRVWIEREGVYQIRQYTLSDAPERARKEGYRITPKRIGMVSEALHQLKKGDEVDLSFPVGVFFFEEEGKMKLGGDEGEPAPLVLLSAGIGITPLLSILTSILPVAAAHEQTNGDKKERKISWIHSSKMANKRPFQNMLEGLGSQHPQLRSKIFVTGPQASEKASGVNFAGRMDLTKLDGEKDLYLDDGKTQYYLCGPGAFMESVGKTLKEMGVSEDRIKAEVFGVGNPSF